MWEYMVLCSLNYDWHLEHRAAPKIGEVMQIGNSVYVVSKKL